MAKIMFKTKVITVDGRDCIRMKKTVSRLDCDLKPADHTYYNSNLFPQLLNRAYRDARNNQPRFFIDEVPSNITVDTSQFLAVVTVELPKAFN